METEIVEKYGDCMRMKIIQSVERRTLALLYLILMALDSGRLCEKKLSKVLNTPHTPLPLHPNPLPRTHDAGLTFLAGVRRKSRDLKNVSSQCKEDSGALSCSSTHHTTSATFHVSFLNVLRPGSRHI